LPTSIPINRNQHFDVTIQPKAPDTQTGAIATGVSPVWVSSNPAVVGVNVAGGGMSATITSASNVGTATLSVTGQGFPSGTLFTSTFDVTVLPASADHFDFTFTTPVNN